MRRHMETNMIAGRPMQDKLLSYTAILLTACAFLATPCTAQSVPAPTGKPQEMLDLPIVPGGTATQPALQQAPASAPAMRSTAPKPPSPELQQLPPPSVIKDTPPPSSPPPQPVVADASGHTGATLMFNADEMAIVAQIIKAYDSYSPEKKETKQVKEDFSSLLTGLQGPPTAVQGLDNVYLQEIVYYSPRNWLVRINGGILMNSTNDPKNQFYVSKVSRKAIELVWKPPQMEDLTNTWNGITDYGKHPIPDINVSNGTVTLLLRTNQTFLVKSVAIREGIIKSGGTSNDTSAAAPLAPTASPSAAPSAAQPVVPLEPQSARRPPGGG